MNLIDLLLLAQAASPAPEAPPQPSFLMSIMPLIFVFVIFYFLLIRPQQRRQKAHEKLVASIKTGDKVVTSSGIHGIVANVKEKTILVKVADNVKIEFDRASVVRRGEERRGSGRGQVNQAFGRLRSGQWLSAASRPC